MKLKAQLNEVAAMLLMAVLITSACTMLHVETADALAPAETSTTCSLPYVDDVNPCGAKAYNVTLTCCGNAKSFAMKAVDMSTHAKARVVKHGKRVWSARLKTGHVYRISVKAVGAKAWKSIYYGIA